MGRRRDPTEFIETLGALKRCLASLAAQTYATAEMGSTQANLLRYIGEHSRISQADLARATGTDPTLTGRALQTLIERGLVRRERSDEDRREYVLELGAAGRRAQERVEKLRASLAARVVSALDARDLDDFDRIAKKILAAFEAAGERS
jgi:DNA-binding MarR family transcriptional regulator